MVRGPSVLFGAAASAAPPCGAVERPAPLPGLSAARPSTGVPPPPVVSRPPAFARAHSCHGRRSCRQVVLPRPAPVARGPRRTRSPASSCAVALGPLAVRSGLRSPAAGPLAARRLLCSSNFIYYVNHDKRRGK
ncbi:hypothetical protein SORBI_3010G272900 [Sorghum bicolor]|uniref:Uncharacterized protein n=1 Tax=Sorghum bicolor TaxID=4558 RepID=A0A1W0VV40_SORBI|nr:hypothetical protein SORBI_3010G272900 [Sorghum bicolor]